MSLPFLKHRPSLLGSNIFARSAPRVYRAFSTRSIHVPILRCSAESERREVQLIKDSDPEGTPVTTSSRSTDANLLLAVGAVVVAVGSLFLVKTMDGAPALERLRSFSTPLDVALTNGRPTVMEFYADWCEVCNELAPITLQVTLPVTDTLRLVPGKFHLNLTLPIIWCRLKRHTKTPSTL